MSRHDLWCSIDHFKRKMFLKNELKKQLLKAAKRNKYMSYVQRNKAAFHLSNLPKVASKTVINNRCVISGRSQSVDKKTRLSRFVFREKTYKSHLPGFRRAS